MTNNNSTEMKTAVETFIIEETVELIYDNDKLEKWNELVKELGLTGQTKIVHKDKSPIPFMHLKTGLKNTLECLCPRKIEVEKYDVTPIPVEILDLIALSKRELYFQKVEIWYDERNPDPCCIGMTADFIPIERGYNCHHDHPCKNSKEALEYLKSINKEPYNETGGYWFNEKFYLLGKWADIKHSFEELKEMAKKRFIEEKGNDYRKQIKEAERGLTDLENEAFEKFN